MTFAQEAAALTAAAIAKQETADPNHIATVKSMVKEAARNRLYEVTVTAGHLTAHGSVDLAVLGRCCERELGLKTEVISERHPGGKQELRICWGPPIPASDPLNG